MLLRLEQQEERRQIDRSPPVVFAMLERSVHGTALALVDSGSDECVNDLLVGD